MNPQAIFADICMCIVALSAASVWYLALFTQRFRGPQGPEGNTGLPGRDGRDGRDGTNGTDGVDGTNGVDGKDGQHSVSVRGGRLVQVYKGDVAYDRVAWGSKYHVDACEGKYGLTVAEGDKL